MGVYSHKGGNLQKKKKKKLWVIANNSWKWLHCQDCRERNVHSNNITQIFKILKMFIQWTFWEFSRFWLEACVILKVAACLVVAVQPCMEWIPIKKTTGRGNTHEKNFGDPKLSPKLGFLSFYQSCVFSFTWHCTLHKLGTTSSRAEASKKNWGPNDLFYSYVCLFVILIACLLRLQDLGLNIKKRFNCRCYLANYDKYFKTALW